MKELLTTEEHDLVELLGECYNRFKEVVGEGSTRHADLTEFVTKIHDLQNSVLSQAAARAYPGTYRELGETLVD